MCLKVKQAGVAPVENVAGQHCCAALLTEWSALPHLWGVCVCGWVVQSSSLCVAAVRTQLVGARPGPQGCVWLSSGLCWCLFGGFNRNVGQPNCESRMLSSTACCLWVTCTVSVNFVGTGSLRAGMRVVGSNAEGVCVRCARAGYALKKAEAWWLLPAYLSGHACHPMHSVCSRTCTTKVLYFLVVQV